MHKCFLIAYLALLAGIVAFFHGCTDKQGLQEFETYEQYEATVADAIAERHSNVD